MTAVTTWTPQRAEQADPSRHLLGADPLDDAGYHFTAGHDPYPYARFEGHLPALRLPMPHHGGLFRTSLRGSVLAWSVVDLSAFAAALRFGSASLGAVALVGLLASSWHLHDLVRRRRRAARPLSTRAVPPVLTRVSSGQGRSGSGALPTHARARTPATIRRSSPPRTLRLPASAALAATTSVLAGLVIHLALNPTVF